jgi:nicotinate-nucleotide adenylyltransferase
MKVALFGGSFDPPHTGHQKIIKKSLKKLKIDKLVVMPTYLNPFKKKSFVEPELKLIWLEKICHSIQDVIISDFEISQNRAVYTIESVEHLKKSGFDVKYLIIGADNLKHLKKWGSYHKLKREVKFVVVTRKNIKIPKEFKKLKVKIPISSGDIRDKFSKKYIPKEIREDIKQYYKESYETIRGD